jgi:hypothetical protein
MHGKTRTRLDWLPQHVLSFLTATERNYWVNIWANDWAWQT